MKLYFELHQPGSNEGNINHKKCDSEIDCELVAFAPFIFFFDAFHFFISEIIFDIKMLKNIFKTILNRSNKNLSDFFWRFSANLSSNNHTSIIKQFWYIKIVGGENYFLIGSEYLLNVKRYYCKTR